MSEFKGQGRILYPVSISYPDMAKTMFALEKTHPKFLKQ